MSTTKPTRTVAAVFTALATCWRSRRRRLPAVRMISPRLAMGAVVGSSQDGGLTPREIPFQNRRIRSFLPLTTTKETAMSLKRQYLLFVLFALVGLALCGPVAACPTADLDCWGVPEPDEVNVGDLLVRRFDGNNAPRHKITIHPVQPNDWAGNVVLTKKEEAEGGKIKVFTTLAGDTEITFNGTDNKFANADLVQNPKELYVQGNAGSDSWRDIELKAEPEGVPQGADTVKFTVLWVGISWKRLSTETPVPEDNSRLQNYITLTGDDKLGLLDDNDGFRSWYYQIKGEVSPQDFDQYEEIDWNQDLQGRIYLNNWFKDTPRDFSAPFPPGNDGPPDPWQDKAPQSGGSGGKVYYLDGPGIPRDSALPIGTIIRLRGNFKVAALFTGWGYTDQRCSEIWTHYVRHSMKKTNAPPGNTWGDPADVPNDKQANSGSFTRLSWDLNSPTVTAIAPNNGTNDGTVDITNLAGTSFVHGATIKLTNAGQAEIVATNVSYESVTKITCTFDLTGKAAGQWNVVVINPADESNPATLANGFTISEP